MPAHDNWIAIKADPGRLDAKRASQRSPEYRARRRSDEYKQRRRAREASPEFRAYRRAYRIGRGEYGKRGEVSGGV